MSDAAERPFHDLRRALHNATAILSLRRWAFFIPFCVVSAAAFIGSLYVPRTYVASARFERRDDPILIDLPISEGIGSFSYFRQTLERDVVSPEAVSEVLESMGAGPAIERQPDGRPTPASQALMESIARSVAPFISVTSKERTSHLDLVEIRYTGPDPEYGIRLVDGLKTKYIQRTQTRIREVLLDKRDWYTQRLSEATNRLNEAQKNLTLLRMENPGVDPANPGTLAERIDDLNRERRELELQKRRLDIDLHAQEQLLHNSQVRLQAGPRRATVGASAEPIGPVSSETLRIVTRLKSLDAEIERLRADRGMKDEHPEMAQLLSEHRRLEAQLDQQRLSESPTGGEQALVGLNTDPLWLQWQQENDRCKVQIEAIRQQIQEVDGRIASTEQKIEQLTRLREQIVEKQEAFARATGEVSLAANECGHYRNVLSRIEPVLVANEQGKAVIFTDEQPARGSHRPISPQTKTIILVALILGGCAGVAAVILAEVADHVCRSSHQVARSIGLTVLDTIDVIVTATDRRRSLIKRLVLVPAAVTMGLTLVGGAGALAYLSIEHPSAYAQMKRLPNRVLDHLELALGRERSSEPDTDGPVALVNPVVLERLQHAIEKL